MNNFDIEKYLDLSDYATEERVARRKNTNQSKKDNKKPTAEFFTPYSIVKNMCDRISDKDWADPTKTFLEPCFGSGQFCLYILYKRLTNGVNWKDALETLYGVELMEDNVLETKMRILGLLDGLSIEYDKAVARDIMNKNLVCSDFFKWDFENWKPLEKPLF